MFRFENFGKFWIIISKVGGKLWRREGYMEQYLSDRNQLHIFDNDNFSIIPKSIFSDNDNLPISCKNAEISAVDNFFDNIAHPYLAILSSSPKCKDAQVIQICMFICKVPTGLCSNNPLSNTLPFSMWKVGKTTFSWTVILKPLYNF